MNREQWQRASALRRVFAAENEVRLDPDMSRVQVVLPAVFSLRANYNETVSRVQEIRNAALRDGRRVMIHFDHVETVEPAAALMLAAEIFRINHLRSKGLVTGNYPARRSTYDLLAELGFYSILEIEERFGRPTSNSDPTRPIFLRFVTGNRVIAANIDQFVGIIDKHLIPLNAVARGKLIGAIIEAMSNSLDHAYSKPMDIDQMRNRWWMSSKVNVTDREVTILLLDQGVGIPTTLEPSSYEKVLTAVANLVTFRALTAQPDDGQMIMAATELGRTRTGQSGRGTGFRKMKSFVDACEDGHLRVLSNRGCYDYIGGDEKCSTEVRSLSGTIIEWRFRHSGSVDMVDD